MNTIYEELPDIKREINCLEDFPIQTLESAVWQTIQKMVLKNKLPIEYCYPYCKSEDFMIRDIWWNVLLVTFAEGKKLKPIFVSKIEVCKRLSPSNNKRNASGTRGNSGGGIFFDNEIVRYSPRVGAVAYWNKTDLTPWTWYLKYSGKEGKKKATEMSVYLFNKGLAWAATVRPLSRMNDNSGYELNDNSGYELNDNSGYELNDNSGYELKIWGLSGEFARKLIEKDRGVI